MKLSKIYSPNESEPNIYAMWESSGAFKPRKHGDPYSIVMPPPNANGNLHMGHALIVSLQDILVRYNRLKGKDAIYIPGADHAGFETWVVYERELQKNGHSRFDFTREQLYGQVWDFVEKQRGNMELQLRALGASADWDDLVFTLDKKVIDVVYQTFNKLWQDGLVYRGKRIVNYCTYHQTGFADIEVEHKNEKGTLWKIAYPLLDKIGEVVIATTRPETIFGDVAIAVNPNDDRYKNLVGSKVILPLVNKEIPIIADEYVDVNYGTGVVKITPAHDPNDFEVGKRHDLKPIQVIDYNGKMINVPSEFVGLDVEAARKRTLAALQAADLMRGDEPIVHAVGHCYKCNNVIQPLLKDQWFLKVKPLVEMAKEAIKNNEISFTPDNKGQVLIQYLDNLRDWNLSRQIPWGIPIPAFQNVNKQDDWIFDTRVDEKTIVVNGNTYRREEDTFDTWFSSSQWPFVVTDVLGNKNLENYYPTSVMETGFDLLDRWVARMIMLGLYATGKVPFKHVYMNGMVLDEKGQKMSKSKGNVINPIDTISKYGSDALRLGLVVSRSAGQNQAFSLSKVVAARNFCNKLWNVARYIEDKLGDNFIPNNPQAKTLADNWIISEVKNASENIDRLMDQYRFAEAVECIYHFVWDTVADWYIESSKKEDNLDLLSWVLENTLRMAHPFAPFVTETIWQTISWKNDLLISDKWPELSSVQYNVISAEEYTRLQSLVSEARYVTSELPGNKHYKILYQNDSLVEDNLDLIKYLTKAIDIEKVDQPRGLRLANSGREAWLDITEDEIRQHKSNLEKRLKDTTDYRINLEKRLSNENYINRAPADLVEQTKRELEEKKDLEQKLHTELEVIK